MYYGNKPDIKDIDIQKVESVLRSGSLAQGMFVERLEDRMKKLCNRESAAAFSSATSAFECLWDYLDLGEGDEVILSPMTFKSVPMSIIRSGATPVFVDTNYLSLADWYLVKDLINSNTKAIVVTNLYGMPDPHLNMLFDAISDRDDIFLIEDNAQAIGAKYADSRPVGSWASRSDFSIFSFYATKNITSIEGGVILFDDDTNFFHQYRNNGTAKNIAGETCLGTNMRMSDVAATLGVSQLERLEHVTMIRNEQAKIYRSILSIDNPQLSYLPHGSTHAFHHYTVLLPYNVDRAMFISEMSLASISIGIYYEYLLNYDETFSKTLHLNKTPEAKGQSKRCVSLPLGTKLNRKDIIYIANTFNRILEKVRSN